MLPQIICVFKGKKQKTAWFSRKGNRKNEEKMEQMFAFWEVL